MADIQVSADSSLIDNLFSSLDYPWRKRIDGGSLVAATDSAPGDWDAEVEPLGQGGVDDEVSGDGEAMVDELVAAYLDDRGSGGSGDPALSALLDTYAGQVTRGSARSTAYAGVRDALLADSAGGDKLETFFRAADRGASIEWVDFELSHEPGSNLGNPVALTDLRIAVRAKAELCVRILGRKICVRITTPWFRFEGRRAEVRLLVQTLKIKAQAKVSDVDFVITVRIGPFKFKFRIGVTTIINKSLAKSTPVLADFAAVRIVVPGLGLTYAPTAVAVPDSTSATTVEIDGAFG